MQEYETLAHRLAKKYGDMAKKKYFKRNPHVPMNEKIALNEEMHYTAERFKGKNLFEAAKELLFLGSPQHVTPASCPDNIYRKLHNKLIEQFGDENASKFESVHADRGVFSAGFYEELLGETFSDTASMFITTLDIELNGHKDGDKRKVTYTTLWHHREENGHNGQSGVSPPSE
ncbi:MAG: hypothetical protein NTU57_01990 [Candidatus Aenigmarchaeota archaeon]|nr:hypothetical protein [Candidatus Aenigmarchaeota archaeon]